MAVLRFSSEIRAQTSSSSPFVITVPGREQGPALLLLLPYMEARAGEGVLAPPGRAAPGSLPQGPGARHSFRHTVGNGGCMDWHGWEPHLAEERL